MSNDALGSNHPSGTLHIVTHTSDWLWAVFAIMLVSLLVAVAHSVLVGPGRGRDFFRQLPVVVLAVSSIAYFSMASDLGFTTITTEFSRGRAGPPSRQIWYVRYIQWAINGPLLLLGLLLFKGVSYSHIFTTLSMCLVLVVSGLVGSLVASQYKWGYFVFGVMALFYIWYGLFSRGSGGRIGRRRGAGEDDVGAREAGSSTGPGTGTGVHPGFLRGAGFLSFIWLLYPICWALSEGGNVISPTGEMIFYGILDLLSGPVFLLLFLHGVRDVAYGGAATGVNGRGATRGEKGDRLDGNGAGSAGGGATGAPVEQGAV